jgi:hypothetical protein
MKQPKKNMKEPQRNNTEEDKQTTNLTSKKEIDSDSNYNSKKRGIKRTISYVHNKSIVSKQKCIVYFDSKTLVQYNLLIGQYIQISVDTVSKNKVWAAIDLDPKLEKHSVALSYKLANTLSIHNVVNVILLIYLNSGKSVFNIASVSLITIKILDIFPCSNHILCKSFKQWAIAEKMCFVKDEKIEYEFCGRIFTFILSTSEVKSKELFRVGTSTNFKVIEYGFINNFTEENQIKWLDALDDIAIKIPGYTKQVYKFCEYMFSNPSGGFRGILLRGESGVGKTYFLNHILEAFSRRYPSHFTKQNITHELMRSNVGEAERYIRLLFTELLSKRGGVHVICIESLLDFHLGARTEQLLVAELIHCMDLASKQNNVRIVLVAIMSNRNMVDSSLIRVGRLEYEIELKIPAPEARLEIFNA